MRLRFLVRPLLLACLALVAATACSHRTAPDTVPHPTAALDPPSAPEWERDMARFAAEDAATPPPAKAYVFTGSSSVRMWDSLAADFPGKPVLNRGFGGSQLRDAAHYADQVAVRYRPRMILLYAGDNDINAGRSPNRSSPTSVPSSRASAATCRAPASATWRSSPARRARSNCRCSGRPMT